MPRILKVAAAQLGPIHLATKREEVLSRMISLLQSASNLGAQLVVFPEASLTTFFPRYPFSVLSRADAAEYFDNADTLLTSPRTRSLFDEARKLNLDVYLGFAENTPDGHDHNSSVYYSASQDRVIAKYRKVHLPGTLQPFDDPNAINQLEKLWFSPGDLGFEAFRAPGLIQGAAKIATSSLGHGTGRVNDVGRVDPSGHSLGGDPIFGMLICNDRRWGEAWRCYGLQGVEVVLCGYNTTAWAPDLCGIRKPQTRAESEAESLFQHKLVMTGNSYMNSCFSVCSGKAGIEDGRFELINGSMIVSPDGYVLAEAKSKDDEVVFAEIDLDDCKPGKEMMFNFGRHRRIEAYGRVTEQRGVQEPDLLG